ncbi:MAG: hypothetical protein ACHBN1_32375 [Heteroscytonema crispum UTEX LB 1556]
MTVKVYIWYGDFIDHQRIFEALYTNADVGHASMIIIDNNNPKDTIYISHRPCNDSLDTIKNYQRGISVEKRTDITFEKDCKIGSYKNYITIEIPGLNESRMRQLYNLYKVKSNEFSTRELYEQYKIINKLNIAEYHIQWSNCCTVVAYFIKQGLGCPYQSYCSFCSPRENIPLKRELVYHILRSITFAGTVLVGANYGILPFLLATVARRFIIAKTDAELEFRTADTVGSRDSGIEKFRDFWSIENLVHFLNKINDNCISDCQNGVAESRDE